MSNKTKQIYLVLSQTGTLPSKLIRAVTREQYNHVSISLDPNLETMYSFGRRRPRNPLIGGFVTESPGKGTLARFPETKAAVLSLDVTPYQYNKIKKRLDIMNCRAPIYNYNYIGLFCAAFNIKYKKKNCFYCSEFVKDILVKNDVASENKFDDITHPIYFLTMENTHKIYEGKLTSYSSSRVSFAK